MIDSGDVSLDVSVEILDGEGVRVGSCRDLVFGVNSTCLTVEGCCSEDGKVPGRMGSSLFKFMPAAGIGKCVPAAILAGSSENLG